MATLPQAKLRANAKSPDSPHQRASSKPTLQMTAWNVGCKVVEIQQAEHDKGAFSFHMNIQLSEIWRTEGTGD